MFIVDWLKNHLHLTLASTGKTKSLTGLILNVNKIIKLYSRQVDVTAKRAALCQTVEAERCDWTPSPWDDCMLFLATYNTETQQHLVYNIKLCTIKGTVLYLKTLIIHVIACLFVGMFCSTLHVKLSQLFPSFSLTFSVQTYLLNF